MGARHVLRRLAERDRRVLGGKARVHESPADRGVGEFLRAPERLLALGEDVRRAAHRFHAARDVHVALPRLDHARGHVDRLQAGGAEPVHRRTGHGLRKPRDQRGHARDVSVVLAGLVGGAEVDVVDERRVDARAVHHRADRVRGQVIRADGGERPAVPPHGRAQGGDDGGASLHRPRSLPSGRQAFRGTRERSNSAGGGHSGFTHWMTAAQPALSSSCGR